MFCSPRTSTLAQRALGAISLARSFLLLEDDYAVDWEVDADEPATPQHPHRVPLRGRSAPRREGTPQLRPQPCLTPVRDDRGRRRRTGRSRRELGGLGARPAGRA
jgi:hypothetical protein